MTPTIRIRYCDEYGAEFYYRGTRYWIDLWPCRGIHFRVMWKPSIFHIGTDLRASTIEEAIREAITIFD